MRRGLLIFGLLVAAVLAILWFVGALAVVQHWILDQQRAVQNQLAAAVRALRAGQPGALLALMTVCFAYGVVHAAGPGHGKLVIGSYGVARRVRLLPLVGIALAASLVQAAFAVGLVGVGVTLLGWTRDRLLGISEDLLAPVGTAAIAGVGLWLMVRGLRGMCRRRGTQLHERHGHGHDDTCTHAHGPTVSEVAQVAGWRDAALLIGGIALRPCSGALFLLILCFGLGIGAAGIAGTFAMGLGTACVTIAVAGVAVWAREGAFASLTASGTGRRLASALPTAEALAGALLAGVALSLLAQAL